MTTNEILAKSKDKYTGKATTLAEHTNDLLICYGNWLEQIQNINPQFYDNMSKWDCIMRDVILFHDQGKRLVAFQQYLRGTKVDYVYHEFLSAALISKKKRNSWKDCEDYALRAIALHHNRSDEKADHALDIWDKHRKSLQDDYEANPEQWKDLIDSGWDGFISEFSRYKVYKAFNYNDIDLQKHIFFKGMLHKCDYAASGGLSAIETPYIGDFAASFAKLMEGKKLSALQEESAKLSCKSVILIAPTGSGKTELSMNWVRKDNACKVFYLLGMRTAVNKMYKRWHTGFGDNVAILHGEIAYEYMNKSDYDGYNDLFDRLSMIRQLASPITIATADQLVTSTLKYYSFETVYLTCAYSQIIVDEIQSFDPQAMAIIVFFLKEIHKLGGRFMLMTATLPPFIIEELKNQLNDIELLDPLGNDKQPEPYNMHMTRHRFKWQEDSYINSDASIEQFVESFNNGKSVLIICNTVAIAQDVTLKLNAQHGIDVKLLHARFTRGDRAAKEEQITNDAPSGGRKNGEAPTIWVSTQIVEASLDIDFDEIHTEICTIDSLLQRFGRCWRNRAYTAEEPNIFIYNYDEDGKPKNYTTLIYDKELLALTKAQLSDYAGQLLTEKSKHTLFNEVFSGLSETGDYRKRYQLMLDRLKNGYTAEKKAEAHEAFRESGMISYNIIPYEHQADVDALLEEWHKGNHMQIQNEIMQYTVGATIKKNDLAKLRCLGDTYHNSMFMANLYYVPEILYKYGSALGLCYIGNDAAVIE